jgi:uncharacterized membrane protein
MEEAVLTIFGLMLFLALGLALFGVPILFKRLGKLKQTVHHLEQQVVQLSSNKTVSQQPTASFEYSAKPTVFSPETKVTPEVKKVVEDDGDIIVEKIVEEPVVTEQDAQSAPESTNLKIDESNETPPHSGWSSTQSPLSDATQPPQKTRTTIWTPIVNWLMSMNVTAQVGAVVLIFGTIFLGKYASDIGLLTLNAKLWMMAITSATVGIVGVVFYKRLKVYGEILQGTGFAGWLVTLFVTHVLYEQLHWLLVLVLGVIAVLGIGYRAWKQDSELLAMVAFLGGFLTPFIASSDVSSLWRLFGYLLILNLGVVITATQKPWRWLLREAYVSSFGLLALLMLAEYLQNDLNQLAVQLPMVTFAMLCTFLFSALAWRWLQRQELHFTRNVSGLLFGIPAAAAIAFQGLFANDAVYTAYCFVIAGLWYVGLWFLSRLKQFLGIAIVLLSAAIPFALSDSLTSLVYSLEGAAFAYWAIQHNKRLTFSWGVGLQVVAAIFALHLFQDADIRDNELYVSWILHGAIVVAGLVTAWQLKRLSQPFSQWVRYIETGTVGWSLVFWMYHWTFWLSETFSRQYTLWSLLWVVIGTLTAVKLVEKKLNWQAFMLYTPIMTAVFLLCSGLFLVDYANVASSLKLIVLSLMSMAVFMLRWFFAKQEKALEHWDALIVWFGLISVSSMALYFAPTIKTDWNFVLLMLLPLAAGMYMRPLMAVFFMPHFVRRLTRWISLGILFALTLESLFHLGNYAPLPFWPILHPVLILPLLAGEVFFRYVRRHTQFRIALLFWLGLVITIELNRMMFHYAGVAFNIEDWVRSGLTQTVWSLVWATIGSLLMVSGARLSQSRTRWFTGAAVMALIVLKLFLLDLSQVDTLFRIISFIGVGILLLVLGYFAPLPSEKQPSEVGSGS